MEIKRFDDFIICPIPAESELDQVEIEKIVAHTRNTWQHDRQNGEMRENEGKYNSRKKSRNCNRKYS